LGFGSDGYHDVLVGDGNDPLAHCAMERIWNELCFGKWNWHITIFA
jgi:hypothetical protein